MYIIDMNNNKFREFLKNSSDVFLPKPLVDWLNTLILGSYDGYYLNYWSILHFTTGFISGFLLWNYFIIKESPLLIENYYVKLLILHTVWELWQVFISSTDPTTFKGKNKIADIFVDTVMFMLGGLVYRTLGPI